MIGRLQQDNKVRCPAHSVRVLMLGLAWVATVTHQSRADDPAGQVVARYAQAQVALDAEDASIPVSVSKEGRVEMHVANLPLAAVLEALSVQGRRNIIATPNVQGTVTAHLYRATFDEALTAILSSNGAGYREVGDFIYVYTNAELAAMESAETPLETRIFPLHFCSAQDALTIITPMLSSVGAATAAADSLTSVDQLENDFGGDGVARNYVAVRDQRRVLEDVRKMLRELDVPPRQVLVEATILAVKLDEENALGVDFNIIGGVDFGALATLSNGVQDLEFGTLSGDRLDRLHSGASTDMSSVVSEGGLTLGLVKDHVAVFVRALESITDTVVLANPKILALDRQWARVIVGHRDGYLTTTVTETQAIQNVEFLETGTQLVFRPFIGANGIVRIELHPKDSVGTVVNGLPTEQTAEVTTNVVISDGETIFIGGLFREVTTEGRNQVPLLGDIPGAGALFRGTNDRTSREEVIILLTVHIVDEPNLDDRVGGGRGADTDPIRVGLRRHMMRQGRRNVAKEHYWKAVEHHAGHDWNQAMWHARMALHNDPQFAAAAELREEILANQRLGEMRADTREFLQRFLAESRAAGSIGIRRDASAPPAGADGVSDTQEGEPDSER